MCLLNHPDIIQESMARFFHLDKGTIARTVKKMEDAGYIKRTVDPENRRAYRISLTEKGVRIAPEIMEIDRKWEEAVTVDLPKKERDTLLSFLQSVAGTSIRTIENLERDHAI